MKLEYTFDFLKILSKIDKKHIKAQIDVGGTTLVDGISECVLNILKGNVSVSESQYSRLKKNFKEISILGNRTFPRKKRKLILQKLNPQFFKNLLEILSPVINHEVRRENDSSTSHTD
jgi:hypothetical protein